LLDEFHFAAVFHKHRKDRFVSELQFQTAQQSIRSPVDGISERTFYTVQDVPPATLAVFLIFEPCVLPLISSEPTNWLEPRPPEVFFLHDSRVLNDTKPKSRSQY
jgi:hypothetical protein